MEPNNVRLVITHHAQQRMKERMPEHFTFPPANTYIRLLSAKDTLRNKNLRLLRVQGGVIICKKIRKKLIVLTVFSTSRFARFQKRFNSRLTPFSRFIPFASECFMLEGVEIAVAT